MTTAPSPSPTCPNVHHDHLLPTLFSTTAPGKHFSSRSELQLHYQSDWHRYNLKRREANLPMLNESDFTARRDAALALRKERESRVGVDHLGPKGRKKMKDTQLGESGKQPVVNSDQDDLGENEKLGNPDNMEKDQNMDDKEEEEEDVPEINPLQSLFDNHVSPSVTSNLEYMTKMYSFFLPDPEYCIDLEGILGYCSEKIQLGHTCLYCQRIFKSWEACRKHMKDKRHCKILYERGVDQEEFDVFYDFSEANKEFLGKHNCKKDSCEIQNVEMENTDDGEEEWEDMDDDDEQLMEDDDDLFEGYKKEIATHGFDITPLGELVFPDGKIVGHRGLVRYYKQRFAPDRMERAAVRAAREAAGDRLHQGRVINLYRLSDGQAGNVGHATVREGAGLPTSVTLAVGMGCLSGSIPSGRNGKGILVPTGSSSNGYGRFTSLSLYRYRAAVKKQRIEDDRGKRLQYRTQQNMNKMNKKGNVLTTGFVSSLAPR